MLSAADRAVVDRDRRLPGLAVLLDAEATADLLRRLYPEADVLGAAASYLRYKPGTSCLVGYRVRMASGETLAYARASRLDHPDKVHKGTLRRATTSAVLGPEVRVDAARALTVFPFPHDLRLRALARLADPERHGGLLRRILPDRPQAWSATLEPLRHKPERRFVGRLRATDDGRSVHAVVKLYAAAGLEPATSALSLLHSIPPLRLPALLGRSDRHRAYAFEWLEGRPLDQLLAEGHVAAEPLRTAGAALARLHRQHATSFEHCVDRVAVLRSSRATARDLGALQPGLADRARRLVARLERLLGEDGPQPAVTLHGDFSPDQVLARDGEAAIVDLDAMARGEAAIDLAGFAANLLASAATASDRDRAQTALALLVEGYRSAAPGDHERGLGALTSAALLRRAVEPFRLRDPRWPETQDAILSEAEALASARASVGALS